MGIDHARFTHPLQGLDVRLTGVEPARVVTEILVKEGETVNIGQVLLQVKAASLNYRDLLIITGRYPGMKSQGLVPVSDGAGVVADSVPELEWKETEHKARALLRASELVEEGLE